MAISGGDLRKSSLAEWWSLAAVNSRDNERRKLMSVSKVKFRCSKLQRVREEKEIK